MLTDTAMDDSELSPSAAKIPAHRQVVGGVRLSRLADERIYRRQAELSLGTEILKVSQGA